MVQVGLRPPNPHVSCQAVTDLLLALHGELPKHCHTRRTVLTHTYIRRAVTYIHSSRLPACLPAWEKKGREGGNTCTIYEHSSYSTANSQALLNRKKIIGPF